MPFEQGRDRDKFIMESESGGQWYVCTIVGKEKKEQMLDYEIISVHYSEDKAKDCLIEMLMFKQSIKSMEIIKKHKKARA